jgi:hypothetical protein
MGADGHTTGFVGFDNVREVGEWRPEDIDLLRGNRSHPPLISAPFIQSRSHR